MDDYIRRHRHTFTREAVTAELEKAGHARADIDAAWERIEADEPLPGPAEGRNLGTYVWIVYWLGAALIVVYMLPLAFSDVGMMFLTFGGGWLIAYLTLAYLPMRLLARSRPSGMTTVGGVIILAPVLVLLIGGGICAGTVAYIAGSFGG